MAKALTERYGGTVPSDVDELQSIPGIGKNATADRITAYPEYTQGKNPVGTSLAYPTRTLHLPGQKAKMRGMWNKVFL